MLINDDKKEDSGDSGTTPVNFVEEADADVSDKKGGGAAGNHHNGKKNDGRNEQEEEDKDENDLSVEAIYHNSSNVGQFDIVSERQKSKSKMASKSSCNKESHHSGNSNNRGQALLSNN